MCKSVEWTFSRTSACGRSDTESESETGPPETERPNHVCYVFVFFCSQKEFTSAVTIMPQICHENQPPFCHFVMLTGSALFECFLCYRVFTNVCKNWSEVEVVMFKCNNINQSTVIPHWSATKSSITAAKMNKK